MLLLTFQIYVLSYILLEIIWFLTEKESFISNAFYPINYYTFKDTILTILILILLPLVALLALVKYLHIKYFHSRMKD